jgi:septum formation topological specificity factor MinE
MNQDEQSKKSLENVNKHTLINLAEAFKNNKDLNLNKLRMRLDEYVFYLSETIFEATDLLNDIVKLDNSISSLIKCNLPHEFIILILNDNEQREQIANKLLDKLNLNQSNSTSPIDQIGSIKLHKASLEQIEQSKLNKPQEEIKLHGLDKAFNNLINNKITSSRTRWLIKTYLEANKDKFNNAEWYEKVINKINELESSADFIYYNKYFDSNTELDFAPTYSLLEKQRVFNAILVMNRYALVALEKKKEMDEKNYFPVINKDILELVQKILLTSPELDLSLDEIKNLIQLTTNIELEKKFRKIIYPQKTY